MQEIVQVVIGICVLILGFPIGDFLAKSAKEELKPGRKYIRFLVYAGFILGVVGLILRKDVLLFSGFFISIVSSRSLKK
jgi:hypothetical protein